MNSPTLTTTVAELQTHVLRALHSFAAAVTHLEAAAIELETQAKGLQAGEMSLSLARILAVVAAEWDVTPSQILGRSRREAIASARFSAMSLYHHLRGASLSHTSETFGGRDHSWASHGLRAVVRFCEVDPQFRERHERAAQRIQTMLAATPKNL